MVSMECGKSLFYQQTNYVYFLAEFFDFLFFVGWIKMSFEWLSIELCQTYTLKSIVSIHFRKEKLNNDNIPLFCPFIIFTGRKKSMFFLWLRPMKPTNINFKQFPATLTMVWPAKSINLLFFWHIYYYRLMAII